MPEFPYCDKRIDTIEIERKMRGVREAEIRKVCEILYDECITKLERVLYVIKEMKAGLCPDNEEK